MNVKAGKCRTAEPVSKTDTANLSAALAGADPHDEAAPPHEPYKAELHDLQVEFVKLQRHFIRHGDRILVLLESRDSAGKDGSIKRIVAHLSPRDTRVVALGKPSDGDLRSWYFERYVGQLRKGEKLVLFNDCWHKRAGVERVMGLCSKRQLEDSRDAMLLATSTRMRTYTYTYTYTLPWHIVRTDNKHRARLNLMRDPFPAALRRQEQEDHAARPLHRLLVHPPNV